MRETLLPIHTNTLAQLIHDAARTFLYQGKCANLPRFVVMNKNSIDAHVGLVQSALDIYDEGPKEGDDIVSLLHHRWQKVLRDGNWKHGTFDQMALTTPFFVVEDDLKPWQKVYYDFVASVVKSLRGSILR